MKKTTLAVGTLLAALTAATIVPAAYADDTTAPAASADACKGCAGCKGCKPCAAAE